MEILVIVHDKAAYITKPLSDKTIFGESVTCFVYLLQINLNKDFKKIKNVQQLLKNGFRVITIFHYSKNITLALQKVRKQLHH